MKNVSVRWKMIILALITLIGTLAIGACWQQQFHYGKFQK